MNLKVAKATGSVYLYDSQCNISAKFLKRARVSHTFIYQISNKEIKCLTYFMIIFYMRSWMNDVEEDLRQLGVRRGHRTHDRTSWKSELFKGCSATEW